MEFLSEFAGMISKNLICQILLGNLELPDKVPPLTLMVKDSLYIVIHAPIVSNIDEDPAIKLPPIENLAVYRTKRISKSDVNPLPAKKQTSGKVPLAKNNSNPKNP